MSKRLLVVAAVAAGALALGGCVVVPEDPGYGYSHPAAYGRVVVTPPPVIVTPRPYYRYRDRDHRRHYWPRRW